MPDSILGQPSARPLLRYGRGAEYEEILPRGGHGTTGATVPLDIPMQLGAVSDSVTVTADALQLQTATSDIGATLQTSLIAEFAAGGVRHRPQPRSIHQAGPRIRGKCWQQSREQFERRFQGERRPGRRHGRACGRRFDLPGFAQHQWNKGVSTEGVQEFKVLQSNFSPEYGESGDGIVSLTMKSGTNELHGSAL